MFACLLFDFTLEDSIFSGIFQLGEECSYLQEGKQSAAEKLIFFKDLLELALAAFHNYDLLECNVGSEAISDILEE